MKGVIWCPPKRKRKKKPAQLPSEFFLGGWVCVPAPSCLLAGNLLFHRATRLGFSLSLSLSFLQLSFSFPCACWRWLELCCFLGTDAEGRKDRPDFFCFPLYSRSAVLSPNYLVLFVRRKKRKKEEKNKQTNKRKML